METQKEKKDFRRGRIAGKKLTVVAPTPEQALQFFGIPPLEVHRVTEIARTKTGIFYEVDGTDIVVPYE